jgi:hypothetical protein
MEAMEAVIALILIFITFELAETKVELHDLVRKLADIADAIRERKG